MFVNPLNSLLKKTKSKNPQYNLSYILKIIGLSSVHNKSFFNVGHLKHKIREKQILN